MMDELGPQARALLDAARDGLGPDAAAVRRMRAKIDAAIGAGGAGGAGGTAGSTGGAGAGAGSAGAISLAAKLGAVAVVAALVAGVIVHQRRSSIDPIDPQVDIPVARVEPPTRVPSQEVAAPEARDPSPSPDTAAPSVSPEPRRPLSPPAPPSRPSPSPGATAPAAPPPSPPPPPSAPRRADLAREVELVDQAMAALRRSDPAAALAAVRTHAVETAGAGQLAEDAAAIEIEALCRLHDSTVAAKLAAFDAKWPESAQRSRLTSRCP